MKSIYNYLTGSFCLIAALLAVIGCSEEYEYSTDYSFYDGVTLKMNLVDENNVLAVKLANGTHALTIAVTPEDVFIDSKAYIYEVADPNIATVSSDGTITLLAVGETTLTAKFRGNKNISASCTLRVLPTLVNELTIVGGEIRVEEGKELDLAPYIVAVPSAADNKVLRYEVKEGYTDYAEIVEGSILRGLKEGDVIVVVSTTDGSNISVELPLKVTGKIPVERIDLNAVANLNGKSVPVGQSFNLGSAIKVYPSNASDQTLKYELVSGNAEMDAEKGIVTTTGAGEVEIKISAADEFQVATPHTVKFTVDASKTSFERALWFVDTSIVYANGQNYVTDNATGKPEHLIDGNANTYLGLTKAGITYGEYVTPASHQLYFVVDMKSEQEFNYFYWKHRNTSRNFKVFEVSLFGSNNGLDYTPIKENVTIGTTDDNEPIEIEEPLELSKYRYIKVEYKNWNKNGGSNVCVAEFNVGKK